MNQPAEGFNPVRSKVCQGAVEWPFIRIDVLQSVRFPQDTAKHPKILTETLLRTPYPMKRAEEALFNV